MTPLQIELTRLIGKKELSFEKLNELYYTDKITNGANWIDCMTIDKFCLKEYGKLCENFSTYCDGEPFGIIGGVRIPIDTVLNYDEKKHELRVNINRDLKYYTQRNRR